MISTFPPSLMHLISLRMETPMSTSASMGRARWTRTARTPIRTVRKGGGRGGVSPATRRQTATERLFGRLRREYYRLGTFHGKPSGCLMYELAHALRRNSNELLWLACVALTDQFVHERYQAAVMELEQHINGSGNLDPSGLGSVVTLKDGTKIRAPEASHVAKEDEPSLMLLREWSLFDSMLCSSYIATKLKTWSDNGLQKLKLLLARMGFPLADCQKRF